MAERINRIIKDHGEVITLQVRSLGARDSITNQATPVYTDANVPAYISHPLSRRLDIDGLATTEETRTIFTSTEIHFQDKVVCTAGTFMISNEPAAIYKMKKLVFYMAEMVKVDTG